MTPPGDPQTSREEDHRRTRQNLLVLALLVLLLALGLWLYAELRAYLKIEACIEAGYRNCGTTEK
jgi:hypothetical protein